MAIKYNMKKFNNCISILIIFLTLIGDIENCTAQGFQRAYGNALDNAGWKVIPNGTSYYVLGSDEPNAGGLESGTISYLNQEGTLLWTRRLNSPSVLMDGVVTPSGDLIVVGSSLPANESSSGIIGSVDPSGSVNWLNIYDVPGAESFWKIVRSPAAENPLFPYIIAGTQADSSQNAIEDDAMLLSINEFGTVGSKKVILMQGDNELTHDLEILSNGDMILTGNSGGNGTILWLNKTAEQVTAASPEVPSFWFADLAVAGNGGFYAVGGVNKKFYLSKLSDELLNIYDVQIENLTDIAQVWEDAGTEQIYVVGTGNFEGESRAVIMNFIDEGDGVSLNWLKYLDNGETSFWGGSISFLPPDWIGYTDGREQPNGGFGKNCMFVSISDLAFTTCMTSESTVNVQNENWLYNGPAIDFFISWDVPPATPLTSALVAWQEQDVCGSEPCMAEFTFDVDCGQVIFHDQSVIPNTPSWSWTFSGGNPATSSLQNPVVNFPSCGNYDACLTITSSGPDGDCTSTFCVNIEMVDVIDPIVTCSGVSVEFDANCEALLLPSFIGAAFDNCQIQSTTVNPSIITSCGLTPVTFTATDWCGNTASCTTDVYALEITPPVIVCPSNVVVNTSSMAPCSIVVNGLHWISATDACGIKSIVYDITGATVASGINDPSGLVFNQGVSTVTYTATDNCDNTSTCSFTVTVVCESEICCPEFKIVQLIDIIPCEADSACVADTSIQIQIPGGAMNTVACKHSLHNYYIVPNLPGFIYNWTVVGGTLSSLQGSNPGSILWGNGSQGFIQVIITDPMGTCRDTVSQKVCLIDAPIAAFTISPGTTICANQAVTFTNTTIGANSYSWDFGDGTGSAAQNPPSHIYATPGIYTVLLTVSNNKILHEEFKCGCLDTASIVITVLAGNGPTITPKGCKKMFCPGDTASYCVTPACAPYNWVVNGGTIINNNGSCITVQWNNNPPSTFPSSVSVTTGCIANCGNSATLNVPVLWPNMPISGPDPVCVGAIESYSLPTMPGTFYTWSVTGGGGTIVGPYKDTPTINVKWNGPPGNGTISCTYNNPYAGCGGSSSKIVKVRDKFAISGPSQVCVGTANVYTTSSGTANWTISGAGYTVGATSNVSSISVNWSTAGTYTITATSTIPASFCNPSSVISVVVNPAPVVNVTGPLLVCPNQVQKYTATSNLSGTNFTWSLVGSGGTISSYGTDNANASVIFTGPGSWTLMAEQKVKGCTGTNSLTIDSEPVPTLLLTPISKCIGGKTTVVVQSGNGPFTWSTSPAATLISGQGTNSAMYEIHGIGTISVSNCSGPSLPINVSATPPPSISITHTGSLCAGNMVLSAPAGGTMYQWFAGSSATTQTIPVSLPGTYTVQMTFPGGCIAVDTFTVNPVARPTVSISTGDPLGWCIPATPDVDLQAFTLSTGCSFQWYDGNGLIPGATSGIFKATYDEDFYVIVTCGNCVAVSNTISVQQITCTPTTSGCVGVPNPLSIITASPCNPKQLSVIVNGCPGGTVDWDFGDGTPSANGNTVTHPYANQGAYLVQASIICNGCKFIVHKNVNVPVKANFLSSVMCGANGGNTIVFTNASQILGGWNLTSVTWSTDCGTLSTSTGNTTTLTTTSFCSNPTVTMNITVTESSTGNVCTDSKMMQFNLPAAALSILGTTPVCKNETEQFNSSMTGQNIVQYAWTVNTNPVSQNDPLNYSFNGIPVNPVIGLTVTNSFGCTFTASRIVNVVTPRVLSIAPVSICPDCLPPASLNATPTTGFSNYQWYHNGLPVGPPSPTYQLCQSDASGNYYVTADDVQNNGCKVISNTVQVVYHPKPQADIQGNSVLCVNGNGPYTISLTNANNFNPNYLYNWAATGPGAVSFNPDNLQFYANISLTQLGTYQFILTVTDITTGCMAKDTFCVYLFPNPTVTVSGPGGVLCEGTPHTFTASAIPAGNYVYQWSNGITGPIMTTSLPGTYSVTATNPESGCSGLGYSNYITPHPPTILFPVGCDTICDTESITPPLALGGNWPTIPTNYMVQWFINNNSTPFFTGLTLNLSGTLPPPLVYGWNAIYIIVTYQGCSDTSNVYNLFIEKCCDCKSDMILTQNGNVHPLSCDPHIGEIPLLPCPAQEVIVSGFFGFADPITGEPCEETVVIWDMLYANGSIESGTTTNYTEFTFPKISVEVPGTYCLTLTTISADGKDTCVCKVTWIQAPCACCTSSEDFSDRLENNVILTTDNGLCKATLNIGNFGGCDDYIEWLDWEYPGQQQGPFAQGTMPMHTYPGSGTYTVCYLAIEKDINGFICFEKVVCDTITVNCDGSGCTCPNNSLISNPGFESGVPGAPNGQDQIGQCTGWFSSNGSVSSIGDWFSYPAPYYPGFYLDVFQGPLELDAHSCSKYAGIDLSTCEGISTVLTTPIPAGNTYTVGFYWSISQPVTSPFNFHAIMSSGNCNVSLTTSNTCKHNCMGDFHIVVPVNSSHIPGTWYYYTQTGIVNYPPMVNNITFAGMLGQQAIDNYLFIDDVCVTSAPPDSCACGEPDNLFFFDNSRFTPTFPSNPTPVTVSCNSPESPTFNFSGNVHCTGDSCLAPEYSWIITDPNGINVHSGAMPLSIIGLGGNTGYFDLQLPKSAFTPGVVYTITLTTYCGPKACTISVQFVLHCDACNCGEFSELNWRPSQGTPNMDIFCGDALTLGCLPPGFNVTFGGNFSCAGDSCPPVVVNWYLRRAVSNLYVGNGTVSGPGFTVSLPASYFANPGEYELFFIGECGGESCEACMFTITSFGCPCTCDLFDKIKLVNKKLGINQTMVCDNSPEVVLTCPPIGHAYNFTGKLLCDPASCKGSNIHWELSKDGNILAAGNQTGPWYSITLGNNVLAGVNGLCDLSITGNCGTETCSCVLHFDIKGCPMDKSCGCETADEISDFNANANAGFSYIYDFTQGNCSVKFTPRITGCDSAKWEILDLATGTTIFGKSKGTQPFTALFPNNAAGSYKVWMRVVRPGTQCQLTYCTSVKIDCLSDGAQGNCDLNEIENSGFSINAVAGILDHGGSTEGWTARGGLPQLLGGDGCNDEFAIQLAGKCTKDNVDIIDYPVFMVADKPGVKFSACYWASQEDLRPRTELVLRLSDIPLENTECTEFCWEVARIPIIVPSGEGWKTITSSFLVEGMSGNKFLSLHLENDLTNDDPDANSTVLFDNVCFELNDSTTVPVAEVREDNQFIRIYPNPNEGEFTMELSEPATDGMALRIVGLTGQVLMEKPAEVGTSIQPIKANGLSSGMYFIQIVAEGRVLSVHKFVKE